MGRTRLTLKPFVDIALQKRYINFRRNEKNLIEIFTPQYTKIFNPENEEIFMDYERYCNRVYINYKESRGALIQAMKKSKCYELMKPRPKHKYEFRERSLEEIINMSSKKKQKKRVDPKKRQKKRVGSKKRQEKREDTSPLTSGYETAEGSPYLQSPDPMPVQTSENLGKISDVFLNSSKFSEIPNVDDLDINMEEMENLKLTDEQFERLKEGILLDGVSSNELDGYLCNADQSSDNIGKCCGKSYDGVSSNELDGYLCNADQSSDNIGKCYGKSYDGVSSNELDGYLCNADQSSDNIGKCYGKSYDGVLGNINSSNVDQLLGNNERLMEVGVTGDLNSFNIDPVHGNDGYTFKGSGAEQMDVHVDHTYCQQL